MPSRGKVKALTSKFSKPKMSRMPMDLKFSFPLIFWLILRMIQEKHWEYNAMATESRESIACSNEGETQGRNEMSNGTMSGRGRNQTWRGKLKCVYMHVCIGTCSIVSGEQISSPLRIMERWVMTSDSWKASSPNSSLALVTTGNMDKDMLNIWNVFYVYLDFYII